MATFELEQCLTVVERGDPLHLDFSIPFEDADLTADELADSRRFQFFALCRDQHAELDALPNWIAQDDVDRSLAAGLLEDPPDASDVLDLADGWQDCVWRLNADDARIPITCEGTDGGLDFDTTALPPGNYVVRGYTFEPSVNVWVPRRGVVQVREDDAPQPVVSLMSPPREDWQAFENDGFELVGCMGGPPGTTVRLEWASLIALQWTLVETLDAADGTFSIQFDFPPEAISQPLIFRAVATGPSGGSWTALAPGVLLVLPGDGETDAPDPPPGIDSCDFFPDPDPDPGPDPDPDPGTETATDPDPEPASTSAADTDPDTDTDPAPAMVIDDTDGCGCRSTRSPIPTALLFLLLALRRRRDRAR